MLIYWPFVCLQILVVLLKENLIGSLILIIVICEEELSSCWMTIVFVNQD